jgi:hypothetical protein
MRYEDMLLNSLSTFMQAVRFSGLEHTEEEVEKAIRFSSFEELKKQEKEKGFREKSPNTTCFFRKGQIGSWKEVLSDQQIEKIIDDHRQVMVRFGYLDENREITY